MEYGDRNIWKKASTIGLAFTILCLIVCIIQYYSDPDADAFQKTVRIIINFVAVNSFFYLIFHPLKYSVYALAFYVYGCGNFLDNGNILGTICISASFVFLGAAELLKKHRKTKIILLSIPPAACFLVQIFQNGPFIISIMNILGALYIFYLIVLILLPKVEKAYSSKTERIISREKFTERDIEFLERVLNGEKYSKIASLYNISESTVKAQMIELYHYLGVSSRTEFLAFCNGCSFILGDPEKTDDN